MTTRTAELDAALRLTRSRATLGLLLLTTVVVGLFLVRRDTTTALLALGLVLVLVALRIRSWVRTMRAGGGP